MNRTFGPYPILLMLVALLFGACSKEEMVCPAERSGTEKRGVVIDDDGSGIMIHSNRNDGAIDLRNGPGDEGKGGISDDGDDEADKERNRKKGR